MLLFNLISTYFLFCAIVIISCRRKYIQSIGRENSLLLFPLHIYISTWSCYKCVYCVRLEIDFSTSTLNSVDTKKIIIRNMSSEGKDMTKT